MRSYQKQRLSLKYYKIPYMHKVYIYKVDESKKVYFRNPDDNGWTEININSENFRSHREISEKEAFLEIL